jgi:hypothetical protein
MKPIAGLSHAELAGAMRRLDGKAKGGEAALGTRGKDFVLSRGTRAAEAGLSRERGRERVKEERRAWKR